MTESDLQRAAAVAPISASAGALLRAAREAAGMSIDAVAQQLKLAPRQVKALEDGDFTLLPGRTFVRGFMRNYARLVHLDPEAVLGALPSTAAPTLDSPPLHSTAQTMGELPTAEAPRHGWTRWAIPLTLVAIIGATAAWEWMHPASDAPRTGTRTTAPPPVERPSTGSRPPEVIGTPLPNPVAPVPSPEDDFAPDRNPLLQRRRWPLLRPRPRRPRHRSQRPRRQRRSRRRRRSRSRFAISRGPWSRSARRVVCCCRG